MIERFTFELFHCNGGDMTPDDEGEYVSYEDYAALQQKLDAMAAENAALMKFCKNAAFDADYESELGMERGGFTDSVNDIKTPATDAYLNSVRAEGVEMFGNYIAFYDHDSKGHAVEFAAHLRSGTHDTADKAG